MAVPSPVGDVKTMSSISNFVPVAMTFSLADLGEAPEGPGPPLYFSGKLKRVGSRNIIF